MFVRAPPGVRARCEPATRAEDRSADRGFAADLDRAGVGRPGVLAALSESFVPNARFRAGVRPGVRAAARPGVRCGERGGDVSACECERLPSRMPPGRRGQGLVSVASFSGRGDDLRSRQQHLSTVCLGSTHNLGLGQVSELCGGPDDSEKPVAS